MHTGVVWGISVDNANRYLVTASHDKTLRVWDLATLLQEPGHPASLLRTTRPPIGKGNEGSLFATAMTPDGATIAAGGLAVSDLRQGDVYLFDRASGEMKQTLKGLPESVLHLTYSPDGRYLIATLNVGNGIRVYDASHGYCLVGEDKDYGDASHGASFDGRNRLVTSSYDGYLRLYQISGTCATPSLQLLAKSKATAGTQPFSARFSPDGSQVAVGFFDTPKVEVVSGSDLAHLFSPDTADIQNGNLASVAWSADGKTLYAGGWAFEEKMVGKELVFHSIIRSWTDGGRGKHKDIPAAYDAITDIQTLRAGGVVYASAGDPAFGCFDATGKRTPFNGPAVADYRGNRGGFLLSEDGATVQFAFEVFGKSPARFSLIERRLDTAPGETRGLRPATTKADGLAITDWEGSASPKLNGRPLQLWSSEMSRSLAIAPDGQRFLLGTEFRLRLFDKSGQELWNVPGPGVALAVNISGDGKLAVAAFGDGTIRWYRMSDGKELLALFPHGDRTRWVMWTPTGYYDTSPGGEELIGWHVNNGREKAADFFSVGRFRSVYYRPDIVARILQTGDEREAVRLANELSGRKKPEASVAEMLPPVVEITSPQANDKVFSARVTVRYTVRTPSGEPVTQVQALVDGAAAGRMSGVELARNGEFETQVTIPTSVRARNATLTLIATDRAARTSEPATVTLQWGGEGASEVKPRLFVLAVGISSYNAPDFAKLSFPAKDADDFAKAIKRQEGAQYEKVEVCLLGDQEKRGSVINDCPFPNSQATRKNVIKGLQWIEEFTTSNDVAAIFLAGHGVNDAKGRYYFLPLDAENGDYDTTAVPSYQLNNMVGGIKGKKLLFLDTCHAGSAAGSGFNDINGLVNELSSEKHAWVYAATTGAEVVAEDEALKNGAFTKALVEGISGEADLMKEGEITTAALYTFISSRVKKLTANRQHPVEVVPPGVPDFVVAKVKKENRASD